MSPEEIRKSIRLISINEVINPEGLQGRFMEVRIGFFDARSLILEAKWNLPKDEYHDDALVPLVKNWLHMICKDIGAATEEWKIDDGAFEKSKKAPARATPQFVSPGNIPS
jgi:hypothetical protein